MVVRIYDTKRTEFRNRTHRIASAPTTSSPLSDSWLGAFHYSLIKSIQTRNSPLNPCTPQAAQCPVPTTLQVYTRSLKIYEKTRTPTEWPTAISWSPKGPHAAPGCLWNGLLRSSPLWPPFGVAEPGLGLWGLVAIPLDAGEGQPPWTSASFSCVWKAPSLIHSFTCPSNGLFSVTCQAQH